MAKPGDGSVEAPVGAEAVHKQIAASFQSGDVARALSFMIEEEQEAYIMEEMIKLATELASGKPIPQQLEDGTKFDAKPEDLGFDTWKAPEWLKPKAGKSHSPDWDGLRESMLAQFGAQPDRSAALKSLYLLTSSFSPGSDFDELIVPPREGFKPTANRLWVADKEDPGKSMPLLFEERDGVWKFAGIDWEADDKVGAMWKFEESKKYPIAGPGPDGEEVSLKGLRGKIVLIDFWGTW